MALRGSECNGDFSSTIRPGQTSRYNVAKRADITSRAMGRQTSLLQENYAGLTLPGWPLFYYFPKRIAGWRAS